MQFDDVDTGRGGAYIRQRPSNLRRARKKAKHVAARPWQQAADGRADRHARGVLDRQGVGAARHRDDRTIVQERRHPPRIEGRRHHDDAQVVAREPRLPRKREAKVGVNAALVELVEHDRAKAREQRILLQACRQDSFGGNQQGRAGGEAAFEANVPADLQPSGPALLVGDTAGNRARRDATRLQQDDRTVGDQRRGDAGRLACTRRGRDDHGGMRAETVADLADVRVNWKRFAHNTQPVIVRRLNLCNS